MTERPTERQRQRPADLDRAVDGLLREQARRPGQAVDAEFVAGIMAVIRRGRGARATVAAARAAWGWRLAPRTLRLAAAVLLVLALAGGGYSAFVFSARANPAELFLYSQRHCSPGRPARVRVLLRNGRSLAPIASTVVRLRVRGGSGQPRDLGSVRTDENGVAVLEAGLDDAAVGRHRLEAEADVGHGPVRAELDLVLQRAVTCMLSTDKPVYQPGQVMHLRTLCLESLTLRPVAGATVTVEVADGKGNRVFRQPLTTSEFGLAAADFALADQVNLGNYALKATVDESTTGKTVEVRRYDLPRFTIELKTERGFYAPGDTVHGEVRARFGFGQPVADSEVTVEAWDRPELATRRGKARPRGMSYPFPIVYPSSSPVSFGQARGRTDAQGRFTFALPLAGYFAGGDLGDSDAVVRLVVTVRDRTGHEQTLERELVISETGIRLEAIPEFGRFLPGVESRLYLFAAYPDGRPAVATVTVGDLATVQTASNGVAIVSLEPPASTRPLLVTATDAAGLTGRRAMSLAVDGDEESFVIRTDKSVYRTGETLVLEVFANRPRGVVFVDVVRADRCILMRSVPVVEGRGRLLLDLDPDIQGTLQLHAYRVTASGKTSRDTRLVQVVPATDLDVTATLDREVYRPGDQARIELAVRDQAGQPQPAALSVAVVDEAVFGLTDTAPGFERAHFLLQEELLTPKYQIPAAESLVPAAPEDLSRCQPAASLLLATSRPPKGPEAAGERLAEREQRLAERKQAFAHSLARTVVTGLGVALFLLLLPLFLLTGHRLARGHRAELAWHEMERWNRAVTAVAAQPLWLGCAALVSLIVMRVLSLTLPAGGLSSGSGLVAAILLGGALALATVMSIRGWRQQAWRGLIAQCAQGDDLARALVLVPAVHATSAVAVLVLLAAARFLPKSTDLMLLNLGVLTLLGLASVAVRVCTRTDLAPDPRELADGDDAYVGLAIGSRMSPRLATALLAACWLLRGGLACSIFISALAMFLPLVRTTERLGGDGGGGGGYWSSGGSSSTQAAAVEWVKPAKVRRHFPETLLWAPEVITDASGKAALDCPLADSITTWRLSASAISKPGQLGAVQAQLQVFQDFFIDVDVPARVTQGDRLELPVLVYNYLQVPQRVRLTLAETPGLRPLAGASRELTLEAGELRRVGFAIEAVAAGEYPVQVTAQGTIHADAVERRLEVAPDGTRVTAVANAYLSPQLETAVDAPADALPGGTDLFLKIYPGPVVQVIEGLDGLLRLPYGCFEQTSSITHPNVMLLRYLRRAERLAPAIEMRALSYINTGYQRLLSFEVSGGGFDWFGRGPAQVILSAYALHEFRDMAAVRDVDPALLTRTRNWLLRQQRADGSWHADMCWSVPGLVSDLTGTAYVARALAESGETGRELDRALDYVAAEARAVTDPYPLALGVNALLAARHAAWQPLLAKVLKLRREDDRVAWWQSAGQGVTYTAGNALDVETTALLVSALYRAGAEAVVARKALAWLVQQRDASGTWGSTQATVQALRALLLAADDRRAGITAPLELSVTANGRHVRDLLLTPENGDLLHFIGLREFARPGTNRVQLSYTAATAAPPDLACQLVAVYYVPRPVASPAPAVPPAVAPGAPQAPEALEILLGYDRTRLAVDDSVTVKVFLRNRRETPVAMVLVDLGLPPGFEAVARDLDELVATGVIERYECSGQQLLLYLQGLAAGATRTFAYSLHAKYPVKVRAPGARAYLYYEPGTQVTTPAVEIEVEAAPAPATPR